MNIYLQVAILRFRAGMHRPPGTVLSQLKLRGRHWKKTVTTDCEARKYYSADPWAPAAVGSDEDSQKPAVEDRTVKAMMKWIKTR